MFIWLDNWLHRMLYGTTWEECPMCQTYQIQIQGKRWGMFKRVVRYWKNSD